MAKSQSSRGHLISQLSWTAWLLVKRVCPVHLVDELVFSVDYNAPYDWASNDGSVDVFFMDGEYGFSTVGVGAILGNWCEIQGHNYVALLHGEWNNNRISPQELDFMYIML